MTIGDVVNQHWGETVVCTVIVLWVALMVWASR